MISYYHPYRHDRLKDLSVITSNRFVDRFSGLDSSQQVISLLSSAGPTDSLEFIIVLIYCEYWTISLVL